MRDGSRQEAEWELLDKRVEDRRIQLGMDGADIHGEDTGWMDEG